MDWIADGGWIRGCWRVGELGILLLLWCGVETWGVMRMTRPVWRLLDITACCCILHLEIIYPNEFSRISGRLKLRNPGDPQQQVDNEKTSF